MGSGDGSLTGLSSSGSVESVEQYGSPVTGVAAVFDAVFVTNADGVRDAVRPTAWRVGHTTPVVRLPPPR